MSRPASNTNVGILAAGIYASLAALRAAPPPLVQRFARALGFPKLLRFVPQDGSTDDSWTALVPNAGGGAWVDVPELDQGADLIPANGYPASGTWTVGAYGGPWRVVPASTLSGAVTATLDPHNLDRVALRAGEDLFATRHDISANTITWVNGGPSGGTLSTFPASAEAWAWFVFNGTDWVKRASGLMV